MKHSFLTLLLLVVSMAVFSQVVVDPTTEGATCENAIFVEDNYMGWFDEGDHWFTANTTSLPLTVYYYPELPSQQSPKIELDLSCTHGVYEDSVVARMLAVADKYGLSFPVRTDMKRETDEFGNTAYIVLFDRNYRDMLYNQGVTYAVPAYLKITTFGLGTLRIVSTSVNAQCRNIVNTLGLNTELLFAPEDSSNVYLWPIGEWANEQYKITWESKDGGQLRMFTGKDCHVTSDRRIRNRYVLPEDTIVMTERRAKDWIKDIYGTDLYVKLYADKEGVLKIQTFDETPLITDYLIAGLHALIDNEARTITATLPAGTDRFDAIEKAKVEYIAYNGETVSYNPWRTELIFGTLIYTLNITVAPSPGSTDVSLQSVSIDGITFADFDPTVAVFEDVETSSALPRLQAQPNDPKAKVEYVQAMGVPGTGQIIVTAEAGNKQTYTFYFIRLRSRDASLNMITIDGENMERFKTDELHYRITATSLPEVGAIVSDKKATVSIDQPKAVPGFAQITVVAEAGNKQVYSINFLLDPSVVECKDEARRVELGVPLMLTEGVEEVLLCPASDWMGRNISITWKGDSDMTLWAGSSCMFSTDVRDKAVIGTMLLSSPKGLDSRTVYITSSELNQLYRRTIDDNIYFRCKPTETAELLIEEYKPTCYTRGALLDLPSTNSIRMNSFGFVYKFYLPDWQKKDVEVSWSGGSTLEIFVADTCDFLLLSSNIHLLANGYHTLSSGQSFTVTQAQTTSWLANSGEFAYVRVLNGAAGVLTVRVAKDYSDEEPPAKKQYTLTLGTTPENAGVFEVSGLSTTTAPLLSKEGKETLTQASLHNSNDVYSFDEGTNVTVRAIANEHYTFRSWADGNVQNPRSITMNQDRVMTAVFVADKYTMTVTCDATKGRVSGTGRYTYLAEAKIEARAHTGYEFVRWETDANAAQGSRSNASAVVGRMYESVDAEETWLSDNPATVVVTGDMTIEAIFQEIGAGVENVYDRAVHGSAQNQNGTSDITPQKIFIDGRFYILMPDGRVYDAMGKVVE